MKHLLKKMFSKSIWYALWRLKDTFFPAYSITSYAQEGEDIILSRIFEDKKNGFYVDVGAHHPKRFSNTYLLYKKGWSGINIDATPGSMKLFRKLRPKDINIEVAIAQDGKEKVFFLFNEPALNSFDKELSNARNTGKYYIVEERKIPTKTLAEVFMETIVHSQKIDFLSVDVEGMDLEVLQSNDWQRFRPGYILVECLNTRLDDILSSEIYRFLAMQRYEFFAKTANTIFFKEYSD